MTCKAKAKLFLLIIYGLALSGLGLDEFERHPEDGWFNNLIHPFWGAIDGHLLRRSPTDYSDGVYEPSGKTRPNPLTISKAAFEGNDSLPSTARNAMLVFFGQQLVEEILDAQRPGCPREFFNIPVPKGHMYNPENKSNVELPFLRARFDQNTGYSPNNPRQQLNEITPFLDGNLIYGAGKAISDAIRSFEGGRLATEKNTEIKKSFPPKNRIRLPFANPPPPRDHVLKPVNRFRMYGNPRTHENPFLSTLALIWFRYHNYVADTLKTENPEWDDEHLFNSARKWVIAVYQRIVFYEWLPEWLGTDLNIPAYKGYDPNVHPGITTEFSVAALRFGHTLVPSGIRLFKKNNNACEQRLRDVETKFTENTNDKSDKFQKVKGIRLCNAFWQSPEEALQTEDGIDSIVAGLIFTKAGKEDNIIVSDIREKVFGPLEWSRRDLGALNIQRGRDHGLPGYNKVREAYGLQPKKSWKEILSGPTSFISEDVIDRVQDVYKNSSLDELDVFVGGLLETTNNGPGELFGAITLEQFLRIREGDRFWYENDKNGIFTDEEIKRINKTTFADILNNVTDISNIVEIYGAFKCDSGPTGCECQTANFEKDEIRESCEPLRHYDYFDGSEAAFILTFLGATIAILITIGIMLALSRLRQNSLDSRSQDNRRQQEDAGPNEFYAVEWVGRLQFGALNSRDVKITLDERRVKILVSNMRNHVIRMIDLRQHARMGHRENLKASVTKSSDKGQRLFVLAVPGEIDLVLYFATSAERDAAFGKLSSFFKSNRWTFNEGHKLVEHVLWREAFTYDQRKEVLDRFFRKVLNDMSGKKSESTETEQVEEDILETQLTRTEFADALGLQPASLFVRNLFVLVDTTGDGFISFSEFRNHFGILSSGSPEEKAQMFFNMFDTKKTGKLTKENYKKMIQCLLEMNDAEDAKGVDIDNMVNTVFNKINNKQADYLTFTDFKSIMFSDHEDIWKTAVFNLDAGDEKNNTEIRARDRRTVKRCMSFIEGYKRKNKDTPLSVVSQGRTKSAVEREEIRLESVMKKAPKSKLELRYQSVCRYVDNHKRQIFWLTLYILLTCGIFIERAYYYSVERENAGLRRLAGYGVSVTRGAASAMMFTYASLLVTMSRNTMTFFRETFLHRYIPFDNMHDMHIFIAAFAMFFTVMHVIGHGINLYHISTQASSDLNCYFREYFRATHELASFQYWCYTTITGLTGIFLVIALCIMYVFAIPYARRHVFKAFRYTHSLYIIVYILLFLHGAGRLVQPPLWGYFFIGPMVLFLVDKMISQSRNQVLIPVHKANILPSGVTNLVFKRPNTFDYQSGQWVRISCPKLGASEYHPFTLTSAPHENKLSLHIRAVGPWTTNLRRLYDPNNSVDSVPKIYLDGPFGESHQDWYRFPVSVLIGGGIGITPFASILKDITHRVNEVARLPCHKVYFLWVTRSQKGYEWMTDIIRQVEQADVHGFVKVHIFITQLQEKFDLRTTMLYICERHFQKMAGVSMFTGLSAKTHFGRPKFSDFFRALKAQHSDTHQIGVFSCAPPSMTNQIQQVCAEENSYKGPSLIHHFENF